MNASRTPRKNFAIRVFHKCDIGQLPSPGRCLDGRIGIHLFLFWGTPLPASLFTQDEIADLLHMRKALPHEDWQSEKKGRKYSEHERKCRTYNITCPTRPDVTGLIQRVKQLKGFRFYYSLSLELAVAPRPMTAICRYDIQDMPHSSFPCCGHSLYIAPFAAHRHVYCPHCVQKVDKWDACAELLPVTCTDEARLIECFLRDLNIEFHGSDARNDLFEEMK